MLDKISKLDFSYIIKPIIYIAIGMILYFIIKKALYKFMNRDRKVISTNHKQKVKTLYNLLISIIKYVIVIIVVLACLSTWGINVTSLVAGLGVTSAIIGLAFKDLATDIIAGFSIITENQYEVGDVIEVDGFIGEVIELGLQTTKLKDINTAKYKGATYIIANRYMDKVINYSQNNSVAIVDVSTAYEEKTSNVEKVLNELIKELNGNVPNSKGEIQLMGIQKLDESSVVYRIMLEVEPNKHYGVERFLRKAIKDKFDKENIKIPYNQIEVHNAKR